MFLVIYKEIRLEFLEVLDITMSIMNMNKFYSETKRKRRKNLNSDIKINIKWITEWLYSQEVKKSKKIS